MSEQRANLCETITYQVDRVEHLDLSYCSAARVGQVTVVVADGQRAQSCRHKHKLVSKERKKKR